MTRQRIPQLAIMILSLICLPFLNASLLTSAKAASCVPLDLKGILSPSNYQNYLWLNPTKTRKITWSLRNQTIELKDIKGVSKRTVSQAFTTAQANDIRSAFETWDNASDSINFEEVAEGNAPDIKIGFVLPTVTDSFSNYDWQFGYTNQSGVSIYNRIAGYVILNANNTTFLNSIYLHNITQRAIGQILGLGDLSSNVVGESVMKWPFSVEKKLIPLPDLDIRMIRQLYGEPSCVEDFPWTIKEQKAKLNTEIIVADANKKAYEILANAAQEAKKITDSAVAQSTLILSQAKLNAENTISEAEKKAIAIISEAKKILEEAKKDSTLTTLTCSKGSTTKQVTGKNPRCPVGYKKK